jgi:hypothetical protein
VLEAKASFPMAALSDPVVFDSIAPWPTAVFEAPDVFSFNALSPTPVFEVPVEFVNNARLPIPVLKLPVAAAKAVIPNAVLRATAFGPLPIVRPEMVISFVIAELDAPKATAVPPIVTLEFSKPALGNPVQFVSVPLVGVPSTGVVNVVLAAIDAVFILLRGIVFSQRNCDYDLFITSALV